MADKIQQDILNKILDEYRGILDKYYPDIIDGMGYGGPKFHSTISEYYKNYKQTPFYYNGNLKFVHWTSLANLSSIINNGELRLYNLINSEDEEEFSYAGQLLSLSNSQILAIKERYFSASFCTFDNLENKYLWEKYGKNYAGVAIVISLIDNRDNWQNFFLSYIYYELDIKFKHFQNEIEELKIKYNNAPTFISDIWRFAGFFKKHQYKNENEVRLSCISPFKRETEYLKYVRKELKIETGRNRIVSYMPLKLWSDPDSSYLKALGINEKIVGTFELNKPEFPQLKIEAVYIGNQCGLSAQEYLKFQDQLKEIFEWRLGYSIDLPLEMYS